MLRASWPGAPWVPGQPIPVSRGPPVLRHRQASRPVPDPSSPGPPPGTLAGWTHATPSLTVRRPLQPPRPTRRGDETPWEALDRVTFLQGAQAREPPRVRLPLASRCSPAGLGGVEQRAGSTLSSSRLGPQEPHQVVRGAETRSVAETQAARQAPKLRRRPAQRSCACYAQGLHSSGWSNGWFQSGWSPVRRRGCWGTSGRCSPTDPPG